MGFFSIGPVGLPGSWNIFPWSFLLGLRMQGLAQQPVALIANADSSVGMDLSDALQAAGYRVLGPFGTEEDALAALSEDRPKLAVIDVALRDGPCTALVQELRRRRVGFLVHSALPQSKSLPDSFQGVPWLIKPASAHEVVALCRELSSSRPELAEENSALPIQPAAKVKPATNPLVRKMESFVALSAADRVVLEQISANPRIIPPGTDLVREGDRRDGVLLVMEGFAGRLKSRASGARQIMAYLLAGDMGDLDVALLDRADHTITTLSACKVVRIPTNIITQLLQHHPQIARGLRMATLVDEATLREWLLNVGRRSSVERVAHLICELRVRLQVVGFVAENSYALPIRQQDLADTTGLSNVHANRALQEMRRRGLIELKGKRLTILNLPALEALAEFKANYLHLGDRAAA